ncbi:hypothetical protein B0T21DRAFT_196433 [Apiosordaria backusii]|uniref:Uncharacterized protein n=1 Tax=Apiosordaria backusii TaxID=314023 RepID=A0AA40BE01_9PEZI|nr:hypothetical protein B0T21DRAFT_196433 [Apiosordaria backusii]
MTRSDTGAYGVLPRVLCSLLRRTKGWIGWGGEDITQDFRRLQNQLCFFNITEQVPMTGPTELLVDQTTGTMMDASSESRFSLARDHIGICKFTFDDEQLFRLVVAEGIKALLRSKPKTAEIDDKFHPFSPIIGSEDTEPNFISKPGEASTKQGLEAMDVSLPARTKTSELDQLATSNRDPHTTVDVEVERVPVVVKKVIKEVDVEVERMPVERVPVERVPMEVNEITVVKETIKEVFIDNPGLHRTPEFDAAKSTEHLDRTDSDNVKVRYFGRVKKVGKFFNKIFR